MHYVSDASSKGQQGTQNPEDTYKTDHPGTHCSGKKNPVIASARLYSINLVLISKQHLGCLYIMFALLQGKFEDVRVHVVTRHGYRVEAPVGLAFGCYQPGKIDRLSPLSFLQ